MNRLAVHQSLVHPLTPLELIDLLREAGWDSLGVHIGATEETEPWWAGGAGERLLAATVDRLLETRVTVLDVGRVILDARLQASMSPLDYAVRNREAVGRLVERALSAAGG